MRRCWSVAIEVVVLDNHIAEIYADMRLSASTRVSGLGIARCTLDRSARCIDDSSKLHQHAFAGGLDNAVAVLGDLRIEEFVPQR